ncbi:MAG TPA: ATP-binding protein [Saliniramus sp.]|nr:ATP-binding protein [Saliniramus sp.]
MIGRNRIGTLIIVAWAILCLGIVLVGVNALRQIERQSTGDAVENAERIARLLLANFERTSDSVDSFITNFAAEYSPQWSREDLYWRSQDLYLPDAIVQITFVDRDGRAIANSLTPRLEPIDLSDRDHIRVHLDGSVEGLYISEPVLGRISNMWTIQFTRAIRNQVGDLQAIVVASYDLSDFTSFYEDLNLAGRGVIALVGRDGIVRVRSGRDVSYGQDLSDDPLFRQILSMRVGRLEGAASIDGVDRIGFFTTSDRYPFYTRVAFDRSYLSQRIRPLQWPIVASLAGLALVLTLAMIAALRALRREAAAAERLHQTQRLEALGKLTGGIAHDFNNLLTIVMGNLDLLKRAAPERRKRHIDNAMMAAERGKSLTHQLLAFSRRQSLSPAIHDLNRLVVETSGMLTHTLRADISIELDLAQELWPVAIDPNQLQIALINLAANARDAMPDGGVLRIVSRNLDEGEEVRLTVQDDGTGMPAAVVARAVEPFYTTKELGRGTGLGLAQVHGFVHQSGGRLLIESEPGTGTSVSLVFPRAKGTPDLSGEPVAGAQEPPRGLTVLVVDDNKDIAALAASILEEQECSVRLAHDAEEALAILGREDCDLLLTDIVMPGEMDGVALAHRAKTILPDLPVILMTGYSDRLRSGEIIPGELILKPFTPRDLAEAMQRALAAAETTATDEGQGELRLTE